MFFGSRLPARQLVLLALAALPACAEPAEDERAASSESALTTVTVLPTTSIAKGGHKTGVYTATVAGAVTFRTTGTGDADLYVKKGSAASTTSNDCKSEGSTATEKCTVTVAVGDKVYWDVYAYGATSVKLVVDEPTAAPTTTTVTLLATAQLAKGASKNGSYTAASAGTITFRTSGTGDADLFVKKGSAASRTVYDCKSDGATSTEQCSVTVATGDVVHYSVHAYAASSVSLVVVVPAGGPTATPVPLPPGYAYCSAGAPCGAVVPRVNVCPEGVSACSPTRTTTLEWTVNGAPVSTMGIVARAANVGVNPVVVSGPAWLFAGFFIPGNTSRMVLGSNLDLTFGFYGLTPTWGGTTRVAFAGTAATTAHGTSSLFKHPSFDLGMTHAALAQRIEQIVADEMAITQITPPPYQAFFMPTEMAVVLGGEGNFSYGDGRVTINYGNPDWIAATGGALAHSSHEFSHEFTHTLFTQIAGKFTGNATCLNEGLADALGNFVGYVPDSDFGTAQDGSDFTQGCTAPTEIHAKGNCVLWRLKRAGHFQRALFTKLFAPQHTYSFDSCDMSSARTANAYVVYLTESTGSDMSAFVTSIGLANAGSYAAAKASLGL